MPSPSQLTAIQHVVVLMLENRSFDHMLGWLYADTGNVTPSGAPYDGLSGQEFNLDATGARAPVFKIAPTSPHPYFMPGADPGEGYANTNAQLFDAPQPPNPPLAKNSGFVKNFGATLTTDRQRGRPIVAGTQAKDIMGMYTPAALPVLSGLARGFAVCDRWFASAPTETLPNRAFAAAATSQGHMDDATHSFTAPTIFGALTRKGVNWAIYGYNTDPLTRMTFTDTANAPNSHFGHFTDFVSAAKNGSLAAYVFLEPSWGPTGNSQHPNYNVALGEQLIHDVYYALRGTSIWNQTLLVITYDEHGGCYDHVPPPTGAAPPDSSVGEFGFDFKRFGVRVPTVLVSPLIAAGSVFRAPGAVPLDHTSVLKTVQLRWGLAALTARDAAAPDFGAVLSLATPRTDDPLSGVVVPKTTEVNPAESEPSHLQEVYAELLAQQLQEPFPSDLRTPRDYDAYIESRSRAWRAMQV
jgi:phospholipase C